MSNQGVTWLLPGDSDLLLNRFQNHMAGRGAPPRCPNRGSTGTLIFMPFSAYCHTYPLRLHIITDIQIFINVQYFQIAQNTPKELCNRLHSVSFADLPAAVSRTSNLDNLDELAWAKSPHNPIQPRLAHRHFSLISSRRNHILLPCIFKFFLRRGDIPLRRGNVPFSKRVPQTQHLHPPHGSRMLLPGGISSEGSNTWKIWQEICMHTQAEYACFYFSLKNI